MGRTGNPPRSEDELAEALIDQYGISREAAVDDVQMFLKNMVRLNLVLAE